MKDKKLDGTPSEDRPMSRRTFLRALVQEVPVVHGSLKGKKGCRLMDLATLPDEQLAQIKPVINDDYRIFVDQGQVWAEYKIKAETLLELFAVEDEVTRAIFNRFNGRHTLGEVARQVAEDMAWEEERAFQRARSFFLSLVERMICIPKDPL